jgi:hypothetical protein
MQRNSKWIALLSLLCLLVSYRPVSRCWADDAKPSVSQNQIEATLVNVDKYAVYIPNLVFYWDPGMSKQKIAALTRVAGKLMNKQAVITYSSTGDLNLDRRPLVVDIAPVSQPQRWTGVDTDFKEPTPRTSRSEAAPVAPSPAPEATPFSRQQPAAASPPKSAVEEVPHRGAISRGDLITNEQVTGFIETYLAATEMKDVNRVLSYYADEVDYYSKGVVNKDYIRRDKLYYFRNWDRITCLVDGEIQLSDTDRDDIKIAEFKSYYSVENSRKSITGRAENTLTLQRINNRLQIIDEKQEIIDRELQ